ncbi:MAG: hypothetical protein SynsKO_26300 [Synoicihabitans sp.]
MNAPLKLNLLRGIKVLWFIAAGLVSIHILLNLIHYLFTDLPWLSRQIFDVDEEDSFPTWYSSMLLLLTAFSLWVYPRLAKEQDPTLSERWRILAIGFLFLSVDEIAGMHETLNSVIDFSWTVPGAFVAGCVGLYFIPFLLKIPRGLAIRFSIAGAIYLGGALGVEVLTDPYLENDELNTLSYNLWTAVEEAMEMGGVLYFLGGVWGLFQKSGTLLNVEFTQR